MLGKLSWCTWFPNCVAQQVRSLQIRLELPSLRHSRSTPYSRTFITRATFVVGLTDQMRENFHLMNALAKHTRVAPKSRIDKLLAFNRRLRSMPEIVQELTDWNLKLNDRLVNIPGRILPQESIVFGSNKKASAGQFADWGRELHSKPLFNCTHLSNWVVICLSRMKYDVEVRYLKYLRDLTFPSLPFHIHYRTSVAFYRISSRCFKTARVE